MKQTLKHLMTRRHLVQGRSAQRTILHMMMVAVTVLTTLLASPLVSRADGFMKIEGVYRQPSVSHVDVVIKSKIATTVLEQTFRNPLDKQVTASYFAPVPQGATITGFAQLIDGNWVEATVKTASEAKAEFAAAATQGKDAAMVNAAVNPTAASAVTTDPTTDPTLTFQTTINLPANAERKVRLTFTQVLIGTVGLTRYGYPLSSTNYTDEPVGDLLVHVKIVEDSEIRAVYSPSHASSEIARPDPNDAELTYRAQNVTPDKDFELVYTQSADKFGLNVASFRDSDATTAPTSGTGKDSNAKDVPEDGYFVLIAAPQLEAQKSEVIRKDFVFILDRSGSMNGDKFTQAKAALLKILDALNEGDRFTIVTFDDTVTQYADRLVTLDSRDDAKAWVTRLETGGGTNINDALQAALRTADQGADYANRPHIIVFLTDGQASAGVTDTPSILKNVKDNLRPQSRLYTIGIGDVNQPLLDALAQDNRGRSLFVTAYDALDQPLGNFYAAIDSPVLVDLQLDFGGLDVSDVYPNPLPDMFLGGQVVVTGRYHGGGAFTVKLTGNINGKPYVSEYKNIQFAKTAEEAKPYAFVPRLWAQRKVDTLLRTIQINGVTEDLVKQVTDLGLKYKIATPYTSFVVTQNNGNNAQPVGLPATGLPFLYVDDYRTVNTALMIAGCALGLVGLVGLVLKRR